MSPLIWKYFVISMLDILKNGEPLYRDNQANSQMFRSDYCFSTVHDQHRHGLEHPPPQKPPQKQHVIIADIGLIFKPFLSNDAK